MPALQLNSLLAVYIARLKMVERCDLYFTYSNTESGSKYPAISLHSRRGALLPVTCGAFHMYCGTYTQECQHPDVK